MRSTKPPKRANSTAGGVAGAAVGAGDGAAGAAGAVALAAGAGDTGAAAADFARLTIGRLQANPRHFVGRIGARQPPRRGRHGR